MPKLLTIAILIAGLGPGELPEYVPAGDEAYTLDLELDGYVNGKMDPDRLLTIRGCTLERDAAYTYALMFEAAEEDGIKLRPGDCYRSYWEQDRAYNARCPVKTVPVFSSTASGGRTQVGTREARVCSGPPTAQAGKSNHGWGRAIDFAGRGGRSLTCWDREFHWLKQNAHRFGWVHPAWAHCGAPSEEAWHWEFAGVTDPTLVEFVTIDPTLAQQAE